MLLSRYTEILKVQMTDTRFIQNKMGIEICGHRSQYHNKSGIKISLEVDRNGVWISAVISYNTKSNYIIALQNLDNRLLILMLSFH